MTPHTTMRVLGFNQSEELVLVEIVVQRGNGGHSKTTAWIPAGEELIISNLIDDQDEKIIQTESEEIEL